MRWWLGDKKSEMLPSPSEFDSLQALFS